MRNLLDIAAATRGARTAPQIAAGIRDDDDGFAARELTELAQRIGAGPRALAQPRAAFIAP